MDQVFLTGEITVGDLVGVGRAVAAGVLHLGEVQHLVTRNRRMLLLDGGIKGREHGG